MGLSIVGRQGEGSIGYGRGSIADAIADAAELAIRIMRDSSRDAKAVDVEKMASEADGGGYGDRLTA